MVVMFGSRLYGKVDNVPGLFYVATQFGHLNFVPLMPVKSHLVMAGTEKGENFSGVQLRMSWKSIFIAYFRAALIVFAFFLVLGAIHLVSDIAAGNLAEEPAGGLIVLAIVMAITIGVYWGTHRFTRAKPLRALELAQIAGIPPEEIARHFADRLSPSDLEQLQQDLEKYQEQAKGLENRFQ